LLVRSQTRHAKCLSALAISVAVRLSTAGYP
jgi:hypothetical protein